MSSRVQCPYPTLLKWHQLLAEIAVQQRTDDHTIEILLKALEQLVAGCNSMVILYPQGKAPKVVHHRLLSKEDPEVQIDGYINGAYLLDPYYRKGADEFKTGVFTLKDVAPEGFESSEYYNLYYNQAQLIDEVCFLIRSSNQLLISFSIGRSLSLNNEAFTENDVALLTSTFPLVETIVNRWLEGDSDLHSDFLESCLDNALLKFGTSLLTSKECEILQLILQGNSVKGIADKLDNSAETIKHHRKRIYSKLDISSQAELFHLFIDALRNSGHNPDQDPLAGYC